MHTLNKSSLGDQERDIGHNQSLSLPVLETLSPSRISGRTRGRQYLLDNIGKNFTLKKQKDIDGVTVDKGALGVIAQDSDGRFYGEFSKSYDGVKLWDPARTDITFGEQLIFM